MKHQWVRAKDGVIFGVCKGFARNLGVSVGAMRLIWLMSVLFLGAGVGIYLMLAISLPREDKAAQANESYLLGVCSQIAQKTSMEVGLVRFLALCLVLSSFGAAIIGYLILYFFMDRTPVRL